MPVLRSARVDIENGAVEALIEMVEPTNHLS